MTWSRLRPSLNEDRKRMLRSAQGAHAERHASRHRAAAAAPVPTDSRQEDLRGLVVEQAGRLASQGATIAAQSETIADLRLQLDELQSTVERLQAGAPPPDPLPARFSSPPHKKILRTHSPTTSPASSISDPPSQSHLRSSQTWDLTSPPTAHLEHRDDALDDARDDDAVSPPRCVDGPKDEDFSVPRILYDEDDMMSLSSDDEGDGIGVGTGGGWRRGVGESQDSSAGGTEAAAGGMDTVDSVATDVSALNFPTLRMPETIERKGELARERKGAKKKTVKGKGGDKAAALAALGRRLAKEGGGGGEGSELFKNLF